MRRHKMKRQHGSSMTKYKAFLIIFLFLVFGTAVFVSGCSNGLFGGADSIDQSLTNPGGTKDNNLVKNYSGVIEPVVFMHISDSHFGLKTGLGEDVTKAFFTYVVPGVNPLAVIHTGDLVDQGPMQDYWMTYKTIVTDTQTYPKYVDILGNHDVKKLLNSDGKIFYNDLSVTGKAGGQYYGITSLDNTIPVSLIRTNTAAADRSELNYNTKNIAGYFTRDQLDYITDNLKSTPAAAFSVVLGHHPVKPSVTGSDLKQISVGNDLMKELIARVAAPIYLCGHVHEPAIIWLENPPVNTLVVQTDDFGKNGVPSSFYLVAYDLFTGPAAKLVNINNTGSAIVDWPIVFITSPADSKLGGANPHAKTYSTAGSNPKLQVKIYTNDASAPMNVMCNIGGSGSWNALQKTAGSFWEYSIPVNTLTPGDNTVRVQAKQTGDTVESSITIKIN